MLSFVTHKLRTHSIHEEPEDGGPGARGSVEQPNQIPQPPTKSPENEEEASELEVINCMNSQQQNQQNDAHSSEEELEVINSSSHKPMDKKGTTDTETEETISSRPLRTTSACTMPEKRKWAQIGSCSSTENEENMSHYGNVALSTTSSTGTASTGANSASSDEEVQRWLLVAGMAQPVQFCTSPPLEAVKPTSKNAGGSAAAAQHCYEVSPRKRARHLRQRPYLDFEKMQQMKARTVGGSWRACHHHHSSGGDHATGGGGELSVFCW